MRDVEKAKIVLSNLKKAQNATYIGSILQVVLGFVNCWFYKNSGNSIWLFVIGLNIFFATKGILLFQRGHKITWELENEIADEIKKQNG